MTATEQITDTREVSSTELVEQKDIQFIRSQTIELTLTESRPRTKMRVFFGDEDVTDLCSNKKDPENLNLITDSVGQLEILFTIPGGRFNTGTYEITVTDARDLEQLDVSGSTYGSASGSFSATGEIEIFEETVTTITDITRTRSEQRDPLAQSFFTFGEEDGVFLSSIDVYFSSVDSDPSTTVRCEIRPLENGLPGKLNPTNANLVSKVNGSDINTSSDASLPTTFNFNPPVYLKGNAEYCFVLKTNSKDFSVYTSRMGESSIEDGRAINEQPFVGSLFKSENNVTWTPFQFEDIKFRIKRAQFNTQNEGNLRLYADLSPKAVYGVQFETEEGSGRVRYSHQVRHGLEPGSFIRFITYESDTAFASATLNGIPYQSFQGSYEVLAVPDPYTVEFETLAKANKTGPVESAGSVTYVIVTEGGTGYENGDPVTISGGGGSGAAGVARVSNTDGSIQSVEITDSGRGFTSKPIASISSSTGSGAVLSPSVIPPLSVYVNKPVTSLQPRISAFNYGDTRTRNIMNTTIGNYPGGNLQSYTAGKPIEFSKNTPLRNVGQNLLIASKVNEKEVLGGIGNSMNVNVRMSSPNDKISPVVNTRRGFSLKVGSYRVNDQPEENRESTNPSASVDSIQITSSGSNYSIDPTIEIEPPEMDTGTQATADPVMTNGELTGINLTNGGSGYLSTPLVRVVNDPNDTAGSGAAAQAVITEFNSEVLPSGGNAEARYITKKTSLQVPSTGIRIMTVLTSVQGGYVDWYIRTSSSASDVIHDELSWTRLECDLPRNQSESYGQYLEYEFYLDDITEFDVYDLKCVMGANNPTIPPIIKSYRAIVTS